MRSAVLTRVRHSVALLTERRGLLFIVLDALFIFAGVMMALMGSGSSMAFYFPLFLLPAGVVAVPIIADAVAVERRSGTLDLALTSPGARFYFERRIGAIIVLLVLQGWMGMFLARATHEYFPLSGPMVQIVVVSLFIGAVVLHWAVRLKTAGAVMFATYATALCFLPWLTSNPIHPPTILDGPMDAGDLIDWTQQNLVLGAAAAIFYFYALQRLSKPEAIIT